MLYRLADDAVLTMLAGCAHGRAQVGEVEQIVRSYFHARDAWSRCRARSCEALEGGFVTVLDVRPEDEFALGHLPGALNVPLSELEGGCRARPGKEIVAYCRGPYCVLSFEAVAQLRAHGFKARRLEDGLPEWRVAGMPVAVG